MNTYIHMNIKGKMKRSLLVSISILSGLFSNYSALADDTDIYLNAIQLPPIQTRPNVLFVLDSSGSMGLPLSNESARNKLLDDYDDSDTDNEVGDPNANGGVGDSDYYYIYSRPQTFADQFIYYNKVHKSQMTCDMSTVNDSTPYKPSNIDDSEDNSDDNLGDRYVFETGATAWTSGGTSSSRMCRESDSSCSFVPGPSGPLVDCKSEENYITNDSSYANDSRSNNLMVFNYKLHNWAQKFYRSTVLQTVMRNFIDQNPEINMSLMRFNSGSGGYIIKESVHAADTTGNNQIALKNTIDEMYIFNDSTPLTETLWEAYRFMTGKTADYGDNSGTSTPTAAYLSGTTYNSPIDYACQKSNIVMLTDGTPSNDSGKNNTIEGSSYINKNCSGNCLDEFATWIGKDDSSTVDNFIQRDHSSLPGTQSIKIFTIGFGSGNNYDEDLMRDAAEGSNGSFYAATDADSLIDALTNIYDQVDYESDTSVAPAVAVNSYSGLQNREELYFALFEPNSNPRWYGNLKKYKLVNGEIVDATGNEAVDDNTGFFKPTAKSFWTTARDLDDDGNTDFTVDGDNIRIGGMATELTTPTTRKFYTYTGTAPEYNSTTPTAVDLTNENLTTTNQNIDTLLDSNLTADQVDKIITWARGGTTDAPGTPSPNYFVADIYHNPPAVVTYTTTVTKDNDGNVENVAFDDTVFVGTNMGTLHAVDAGSDNNGTNGGKELFTFIPKEMLSNLGTYYNTNSGSFTDKIYGLDAAMQVWRYDSDDDGSITTGGSDHVHIYQAMRRGGTLIYGLDVTSRTTPKLMWQIEGKGFETNSSDKYQDLAQTWSTPQRATIQDCPSGTCKDREVLFFGGGYDPVHDTATAVTSSSKGNAIYMVDAKTSELLWSAGNGSHHDFNNSDLTNSFTADVTPVDINLDGFVDFLFAVDIYGKLWRFDFSDKYSSSDFAEGGMIADFSGSGTSNFRHFYNAPDASFLSQRGNTPFLAIAVASGHRADPRETDINDRLYVVFDRNAFVDPAGDADTFTADAYKYVTSPTRSAIKNVNLAAYGASTKSDYGWYLDLSGNGEKGLSNTVTFNNEIFMTTYLPQTTSSCEGTTGNGRFYRLDIFNAQDVTNPPYQEMEHGGIPPAPALIFSSVEKCVSGCEDGETPVKETLPEITVCVGTECFTQDIDIPIHKTYWREN